MKKSERFFNCQNAKKLKQNSQAFKLKRRKKNRHCDIQKTFGNLQR